MTLTPLIRIRGRLCPHLHDHIGNLFIIFCGSHGRKKHNTSQQRRVGMTSSLLKTPPNILLEINMINEDP